MDLKKLLIYDFHHSYIKSRYICDVRLLFTDTYNLVCETKTDDVYEYFYEDRGFFDFKGNTIDEFVWSNWRMYLLTMGDNKETKKAKVVNKILLTAYDI